ncbi:lytic polysaccharide monooxygenase [Parathielavia appendiculata]|uniref:Lytic polysaccharide monooxygenase n=1 Tax=Parathielavia appendiculata TaxID=2587402 RepID=A0AAN6Z6Y4_9PEZI|nr:lytic polysaccharide monooxygenase [Parathielavia appendiculata]
MVMRLPVPYETPKISPQDNGPIKADGSDYPCRNAGGVDYTGTATKMEKGSKQKLAFTGGATHGGGSCQISLTYDNPPSANSAFKVIHSIQGGCPIRSHAGNFNTQDATVTPPDEYEFTIPDDIPTGNATLAWTWLNKVGNREFYMNCAPVDITGSEGSESALAALPDMFIANIPQGNGCTTVDNADVKFPNPGKSVETTPGKEAGLAAPVGNCAGSAGSGGSGSGSATPAGSTATPAVRGRQPALRA